MKKVTALVLSFLFIFSVSVSAAENATPALTNVFRDGNFREYIVTEILNDETADKLTTEVRTTLAGITELDVSGRNIRSLQGIAYFKSLKKLDCSSNKITVLSVGNNTELEELNCYDNRLTSLDVGKNVKLKVLNCGENFLGSLDLSKNAELTTLDCFSNSISKLNIEKNTKLEKLYCYNNLITELKLFKGLKYIDCSYNLLKSLDASGLGEIALLNCDSNEINYIDLRGTTFTYDSIKHSYIPAFKCDSDDAFNFGYRYTVRPEFIDGKYFVDLSSVFNTEYYDPSCVYPRHVNVDFDSGSGMLSYSGRKKYIEFDYRSDKSQSSLHIALEPEYNEPMAESTLTGYSSPEIFADPDATYAEAFPDPAFREYVLREICKNENIDPNKKISAEDLKTFSKVRVLTVLQCGISDLKGIEYFERLREMNCGYNYLTEINTSCNINLEKLNCTNNLLFALDVSKNIKLTELECDNNLLEYINTEGAENLKMVSCQSNLLQTLDFSSNAKFNCLYCSSNYLKRLDFSNNPEIGLVAARNNELTEINISGCEKLDYLDLESNRLTEVPYINRYISKFCLANNKLAYYLLKEPIYYYTFSGQTVEVTAYRDKDSDSYSFNLKELFMTKDGASAYDPECIKILNKYADFDRYTGEVKILEKLDELKYYLTIPRMNKEYSVTVKINYLQTQYKDVPTTSYFYDAVIWGERDGIISGKSAVSFCPYDECTRAQAIMFLWRAAGCPSGTLKKCPFKDVSPDAYYYDAVMWAAEKGIAEGTEKNRFAPEDPVRRAQIIKFLYKFSGERADDDAETAFSDVSPDSYYFEATVWGYSNGVVHGRPGGLLGPDDICSRAEAVVFLYRFSHS